MKCVERVAPAQAGEETNSFEQTTTRWWKTQICSIGECFQANDPTLVFFRHGLQDGYISSKRHVEGEIFPLKQGDAEKLTDLCLSFF